MLASEFAYPVTIIAPGTVVVTLGASKESEMPAGAAAAETLTGFTGSTPENSWMPPEEPVDPALNVQV